MVVPDLGDPDINEVIDRLIAGHEVTAPAGIRSWGGSADVMALYHRIGSATLFGGSWRLLPAAEHRQASIGAEYRYVLAVIDLPDGRSIAAAGRFMGDTHWVVCRLTETRRRDAIDLRPHPAELADDPADVPVYGTSLAMLLDAALDSGGDISHLETGRLSDLR